MNKAALCGLTTTEIFDIINPSGFTLAHAIKVGNSLYKKRVRDISQIAAIPDKLRNALNNYYYSGIFDPVKSEVSLDHSIKYLFRTEDGKEFESVFIPDGKRFTVCVSTQSGCRMGCSFCATGGYGFHGDLTAGEIINQVIAIPEAEKVTHVVFMGMGEPMDNFENVIKACEILTAEWGLSISPRNVTVSTVGIREGIEKFLKVSACNLTLSLHSPIPEERKIIIPAENSNPVHQIIGLLKSFPLRKKRRISIAYVMVKDFNDSEAHLEGIKKLVSGSEIRVNLIPYNQIMNDKNVSSTAEKMLYFKHSLVVSGISASIRKSRGSDISAACGLLATRLK